MFCCEASVTPQLSFLCRPCATGPLPTSTHECPYPTTMTAVVRGLRREPYLCPSPQCHPP